MKITEFIQTSDGESVDVTKLISNLQQRRYIDQPDTDKFKNQIDPKTHEVFNHITRPDKSVRINDDELDMYPNATKVTNGTEQAAFRTEKVARIALAIQKLIVKRAVSFLFGNPVELETNTENDKEKEVLKAVERVRYDIKEKAFNRRVARNIMSCKEVAELWYPVESKNNIYGFNSKFKLKAALFSPLKGDVLYPYFDDNEDMIAFSREFEIKELGSKTVKYFETYTDEETALFKQSENGWQLVDGYPKENIIGKIPVVFGYKSQVEWEDVQGLIDRLEKLLSNFADTNDYHASPKIFVKGDLLGFSKKGESGAILQGDENSSAEYLSWANAPESVRLEIETLLNMIYTITQTPDISFESVKGIGAISGVALKLLFMDAHLKVAEHQEVFDEYLQRRYSLIKAFIGKFNTTLESAANNLMIEPIITPYMIIDEAEEIKIWQDANGGNPVMSQKASFKKAGLTGDTDADYQQYLQEQSQKNQFTLNEPTV